MYIYIYICVYIWLPPANPGDHRSRGGKLGFEAVLEKDVQHDRQTQKNRHIKRQSVPTTVPPKTANNAPDDPIRPIPDPTTSRQNTCHNTICAHNCTSTHHKNPAATSPHPLGAQDFQCIHIRAGSNEKVNFPPHRGFDPHIAKSPSFCTVGSTGARGGKFTF